MAMHRGEVLQGAREALGLEVAELNQRMVDMRQAQHGIVQRLRERTEMSVDIIERTVAMTGLKLDELLASIGGVGISQGGPFRSEEHTSELQSLMRISYAVFCLKKKKILKQNNKQKKQTTHYENNINSIRKNVKRV